MSIMYQPAPATYDSHGLHSYHTSSMGAQSTTRPVEAAQDPRNAQFPRYPMQQPRQQLKPLPPQQQQTQLLQPNHLQLQPLQQYQPLLAPNSHSHINLMPNHASTQLPTVRRITPPADLISTTAPDASAIRRGSETLIYHSLQIPKCISPKGGNLAEFAAQVSSNCLSGYLDAMLTSHR